MLKRKFLCFSWVLTWRNILFDAYLQMLMDREYDFINEDTLEE